MFLPDDYSNLQLKNDNIYDFDQNKIYGNYFIEAIDPAHRFTLNSMADIWKKSKTNLPFFIEELKGINIEDAFNRMCEDANSYLDKREML